MAVAFKPRVGLFFWYWAALGLLLFGGSVINGQPSAVFFLAGVGLGFVGYWLRRSSAAGMLEAAPAPAPAAPKKAKRSLFRLPTRKERGPKS